MEHFNEEKPIKVTGIGQLGIDLNKFVVKPVKNAERNYLIDRLSDVTGWSKRGIVFSFNKLPDSWLRDALHYCEPYTNQSTRGFKLKEFITEMKKVK